MLTISKNSKVVGSFTLNDSCDGDLAYEIEPHSAQTVVIIKHKTLKVEDLNRKNINEIILSRKSYNKGDPCEEVEPSSNGFYATSDDLIRIADMLIQIAQKQGSELKAGLKDGKIYIEVANDQN